MKGIAIDEFGNPTTKTIPVPDHKELKTGTLSNIIKQSKLPRSLFES